MGRVVKLSGKQGLCLRCGGYGWVCSEHPYLPYTKEGCRCSGGVPCKTCNSQKPSRPPPDAVMAGTTEFDELIKTVSEDGTTP